MDLARLEWKAIHPGKTTSTYKLITRNTLQEIRFYKRKLLFFKENILTLERPKGLDFWDIRWRMRTQIDESGSAVRERFWIIEQNTPDKDIRIIRESGNIESYTDMKQAKRKPLNRTRIDEL